MKYEVETKLVDLKGEPIVRSPEVEADPDKDIKGIPAEYWTLGFLLEELLAGNKVGCQSCGRAKGEVDGANLITDLQLAMEARKFSEVELTSDQVSRLQKDLKDRFGHVPILCGQAYWMLNNPGESWYEFVQPKKPENKEGPNGEPQGQSRQAP